MKPEELESLIQQRGRALFSAISQEKPSLFNPSTWTGKVMNWCLTNDDFKTRLFRFVDVYPALGDSRQIGDHLRQYFNDCTDLPPVLAEAMRMAGHLGRVGGAALGKAISFNIHEMARQFIIGETVPEVIDRLSALHRDGYAAVVDVLGEATLSDAEAEAYAVAYLDLVEQLERVQTLLSAQAGGEHPGLGWGNAPRINLAVKPTALFPLANPMDFEGSVEGILQRMRRICSRVIRAGGFLCVDMESYRFKEITLEVYRRLKQEYRDYPHIGIVLQAYLTDTDRDLGDLLEWGVRNGIQLSIRLVKGAYWDHEHIRAGQMGWTPPVRTRKADTDAAFERLARRVLENHRSCHLACASHNIRSIAAVLETARALQVPESRYEFQMLYGMAEPVRRCILAETGRVRLYCPYGALVPGMGYLVRRLLENTANESFLRLSFDKGAAIDRLLEDPAGIIGGVEAPVPWIRPEGSFTNEPAADFSRQEQRSAYVAAIAAVRNRMGLTCPLFISGRDVTTEQVVPSLNPAAPLEVVGYVCQGGAAELELAVAAAEAAFPAWRSTPAAQRAGYLRAAAAVARRRIFELAAWQTLEIGKQWDQAHADVAEAIDFLEYYAGEMVQLGVPRMTGSLPGELNTSFYEPRGIAAVIAPWNFPLAISTGMCAAAMVSGNPVIYKPSGLTGVTGRQLVELFREAGLPSGVFNYLPGPGAEIGAALVEHPAISLIAFTGSLEAGLEIMERAAVVRPGQRQIKKVICEMGGKNAIIIDDDADLDEAVQQVLVSAFGFQGQKCSACSRVIVLPGIYERFVERLVGAVRTWRIGPAEDPACTMGAVADRAAVGRIHRYLAVGQQEGRLLYQSPVPEGAGCWVPISIFGGICPEHRLAREEIFGPILAVMRPDSFDQAIAWANDSGYALTGGIFSRSPERIAQAGRELRVGNLYVNRSITGAMVGRQPFGGAGMSGGGTKAGGPDYLLHFMVPRTITENTQRRGFAPPDASLRP